MLASNSILIDSVELLITDGLLLPTSETANIVKLYVDSGRREDNKVVVN